MSSKEVAKTVSKKLKYYLDVKRREDAFDLSGPYLPKEDPVPLRAGPTLAYDGIHDRSLKHYFHNNTIKKQLQHMTVPANMHQRARERTIRQYVDDTMASVDYRLKPGPISPYAFPQTFKPFPPPHRPKALRTVDEYLKSKRGSKRRKIPVNVVGRPRRITRRSPPEHVHRDERERIVNMASKLIVATETVALPQQKKQSKGFQATDKELPTLERRKSTESSGESAFTSGHESESSLNGRTPYPPKKREKSSSGSHQRPQSSFFKSSSKRQASGVHTMLPGDSSSDNEKIRYLMDRMNLDGRGTSVVASPRENSFNRPKSAVYPLKSTANTGVETDLPDYSDGDFCSDDESLQKLARKPRAPAWSGHEDNDMVDTCTQTVVHSATQTKFPELDEIHQEREVFLPKSISWADKEDNEYVSARPPVAVATTGASTSDVLTSTTHETQTRNRDLEPKVITYEVYVQTGDRLGAGSKVNVKITLFGEYGNSGERQLLRSRTHRNKFQRGQVDVFAIDSLFLGKLQGIRIGHNETRLGHGWFLDKVYIKEGVDATRSFEFRCNRWLSSRDDDGQIMRDLPLYDVVPASHVDAILPKEHDRDHFSSPDDGDTTQTESEDSPRELEQQQVQDNSRKSKPKKKSPTKTKRQTRDQRVSESQDEIDGFRGTAAENLFDFSENEEENEDRFFEPEQEYESERSEEENTVDRTERQKLKAKPPKDQKHNPDKATRREQNIEEDDDDGEEQARNSEEQIKAKKKFFLAAKTVKKEQRNAEESKQKDRQKAIPQATTAENKETDEIIKDEHEKEDSDNEEEQEREERIEDESDQESEQEQPEIRQPPSQPSPIPEEPAETSEEEPKSYEEKGESKEVDENEPAVEFTPQEDKKVEVGEDEPAVEFTQEDKKPERPLSAKSDDFEEGFRAGIRKKQEEERRRHKESISESEHVLKSGQTIHDAAKHGSLARIKELIQVMPAMKSAQDERGMTPLHLAASNGHLDCVKWLAVSGVDLAEETPTGYTAMHLAAMNGHVNCMMILAAMGSAISAKTVDALTPLHLASMSGHLECVKWLLANRARVDAEDNNGRTSYDIAEEYGHEPVIKLLKKFKKELRKQDSTLAQLMKTEKRRKSVDSMASDNDIAPSKVSDSGVGGMESEEDNWISDNEEDVTDDIQNAPADQTNIRKNSVESRDRPDSASRSKTDSIVSVEHKKKMFEQQRQKMKNRRSSFLDSIRQDVDNEDEF